MLPLLRSIEIRCVFCCRLLLVLILDQLGPAHGTKQISQTHTTKHLAPVQAGRRV